MVIYIVNYVINIAHWNIPSYQSEPISIFIPSSMKQQWGLVCVRMPTQLFLLTLEKYIFQTLLSILLLSIVKYVYTSTSHDCVWKFLRRQYNSIPTHLKAVAAHMHKYIAQEMVGWRRMATQLTRRRHTFSRPHIECLFVPGWGLPH